MFKHKALSTSVSILREHRAASAIAHSGQVPDTRACP